MLKRLLIAVFVLGLVLALNGTAVADVSKGPLEPVVKLNPSHERFNDVEDARPQQPTFKKPETALLRLPPGTPAIGAPPLDYFCDVVSYYGAPTYFFTIPDAYGDDLFNVRFDSEPKYDCTLKVAWLMMYGPAMVGTPTMRVYLWDDDGFGFPGNKLDSVDIPYATLAAEYGAQGNLFWIGADFSAAEWIMSDGVKYHYGFTNIQSDPGDVLAIISDDGAGPHAGEERSSESCVGVWGSMLNDWQLDVCFLIESELCCGEIPFSDCYLQSYWQNIAYFWRAPHPTYGDEAYSMRFDVGGPETLVTIDFWVYDPGDGSFGNDDIYMTIYGDDAGLPNPANQIAQVTFTAGSYPAFPSWTTATFDIIIDETFHAAFSSSAVFGSGECESCLSSDATDGVGRSASDWGGGNWVSMLDGWGADYNFVFDAYLCPDEYSLCETKSYYDGLGYFWRLPDRYGDIANGMRISTVGQECRVQEVSWALYDRSAAEPGSHTQNAKVSVYTDAGGLPGTELASILLTPADYVFYPALVTVDFEPLDVYVSGDYFVTIESLTDDTLLGIRTLSDDGSTPSGERGVELWTVYWETMLSGWGDDLDFVAYSEHCCIPFQEAFCDPDNDPGWSTPQGNQGRTGASELAGGDAWCDLNLNWSYIDPTSGCSFAGPVIYGDRVVCTFSDHYTVFDITDASVLYTLDNTHGDGQVIGTSVRNIPTIVNIDVDGTPTDVMFIAGGTSNGVAAVDFSDGSEIWSRTIISEGPTGMFGQTRFCWFTVLDIGGRDILYFATDLGKLAAVEASTGLLFNETNFPGEGWPDVDNPQIMTGGAYISGATDGTNLFYATQTSATEGDIYSFNAATGALNWQLSGSGGLQAETIFTHDNGYNYPEGFRGGVAYENGRLYAVSWANEGGASDSPTDGVFYIIDASNGSLPVNAVASNRAQYSTPIVDANRIICPTLSQWGGGSVGEGALLAFNKNTASLDWSWGTGDDARYYTSGFRTCEPDGVDDLVFVFNETGFLECINSVEGTQVFSRRIDHDGLLLGMHGAIAMANSELHIAFADYYGGLYDFTKGADRARVDFVTYRPSQSVEFGPDPALAVDYGPFMFNTGCVGLEILSTAVDENPFGAGIPQYSSAVVGRDLMHRAATIADQLSREAFSKGAPLREDINEEMVLDRDLGKAREHRSYSAGQPAWFVSLDHPNTGDIIAPGDTMNLEITVNQPLIDRGPQNVYIVFETNDDDFFINVAYDANGLLPEVRLTAVGGCLLDTTTLKFGVGQANEQLVTNTSNLACGDWAAGEAEHCGFLVDGEGEAFYQGCLLYGTSKYQLAMYVEDWWSNTYGYFISMQPDPNWCDDACHAYLDVDVPVGSITRDGGENYEPMYADVVCKSWLDSVQNFDTDPDPEVLNWDWQYNYVSQDAPFDDTLTMGLYQTSVVYGVKDVPELANLTLEIIHFNERNGREVNDWYLGLMFDNDVSAHFGGAGDTVCLDRSISAGWIINIPTEDAAVGTIKIPFGVGDPSQGDVDFEPIRNAKGLNIYGAFGGSNDYYDSCYLYLSGPVGELDHQNMNQDDAEVHFTIAGHNFEPNGTYSLGFVLFQLSGLTDASDPANYADLARLVNKWAGFGRGDFNDDGLYNQVDVILLNWYVNGTITNGPVPFQHCGDVNGDGDVNNADVVYLANWYGNPATNPPPVGDWVFDIK